MEEYDYCGTFCCYGSLGSDLMSNRTLDENIREYEGVSNGIRDTLIELDQEIFVRESLVDMLEYNLGYTDLRLWQLCDEKRNRKQPWMVEVNNGTGNNPRYTQSNESAARLAAATYISQRDVIEVKVYPLD